MRRIAALLMTLSVLVPPAGLAADQVALEPPGAGTWFLQLKATLPPAPGPQAIRYTVWVGDKQVLATRRGLNAGYVPYFAVEAPRGRFARLTYILPIKTEADGSVSVHVPPGGQVSSATLRPAIAGIDATSRLDRSNRIYFVGENPVATLSFSGPPGRTLKGRLLLQHLWLADMAAGDKGWRPGIRTTQAALVATRPIELAFDARGRCELQVPIPDDATRLVGMTAIVEDGEHLWAKYLGSVAVVPRRDISRYHPDGFFICSFHVGFRREGVMVHDAPLSADAVADAFKRMGIDWVRTPLYWDVWEPREGQVDWSRADSLYNLLRRHHILAMHLVGPVPRWARAQGPNLLDVPYKRGVIKSDWAPAKAYLERFGRAHRDFYARYRDVVRAANIWNEPWEGGGITGWKSTGDHYRAIVRQIKAARDAADPTIKLVAADSAHNTDWKLFAAGMQDHIDVISTHYSSPATSFAFAMKRFYHKELWETETWFAWMGDAACVRHALLYFANGGDKVSLWNTAMLFDHHGWPLPAVVWTAATRHVLDGLRFAGVAHPRRPPFVLVFEGKGRCVAAVVTTFQASVRDHRGVFRQQFADDQPTMLLRGSGYRFYDMLGNPLTPERRGGAWALPVGRQPRYIEWRGDPAEFRRRLDAARYKGLRPVEIIVHDITDRLTRKPTLRVELRNALPERLEGTIRVEAAGLGLSPANLRFALGPVERRTFEFRVAKATDATSFPARAVVETSRGRAELADTVHEALIVRGTPVVDGDLGEWRRLGARAVLMTGQETPTKTLLEAWFPWERLPAEAQGFAARLAFAYDDRNLYLMARVKDTSRQVLPSMLAGKCLHKFQNPPADHMYVEAGPIPAASGDLIQLALAAPDDDPFVPKYEVRPPDDPLHRMGAFLRSRYIYMLYPTRGGGAEIMRLRTPDFYYLHPLPIDYKWLAKHCKVAGAKIVVKVLPDGYAYEAALPWDELRAIPHRPGQTVRMNVLVQDGSMGRQLQWSAGRSAAQKNTLDFEPAWGTCWSNDTFWGFTR